MRQRHPAYAHRNRDHARSLRPGFVLIVLVILSLLAVVPVRADERPVVAHVDVFVGGGMIHANLRCRQLFGERVIGTVESGLPAIVEVLYKLTDAKGKEVRRGLHTLELSYDVWEDTYALTTPDSVHAFGTFAAMGRAVERLRGVVVSPLEDLKDNTTYAVAVAVAVHPLGSAEREQVVGWVNEQVVGQSSRSWRERVLNIGDLVNGIFSREKEKLFQSEWQSSAPFTPGSIRPDNSGTRPAGTPLELAVRMMVRTRDGLMAGGAF